MGWLIPLILAGVGTARATDPAVQIPFEKYTLANGLDVILSEDHSIPFVQVNLWYDVGSKDETPGRSGFAHLFEHLMFQGSLHMDDDYFVPLQRIGAEVNGTTNTERTNYFEGVPSENLPLALWLESDRMGWLLPALTAEKLTNQKDVVRNERRQSYEMRPYGEARVWLSAAAYPEGHPYHLTTIGKHEDIEAATLEDVKAFFSTWYLPNNATLTIAGDFDEAQARALVDRYFSGIPAGPEPTHATVAPVKLSAETVVRETDDVPVGKVWIAWHTPAIFAPGDAELDILSSVLTDGKDSRLTKALVRETQVAKDVRAYQGSGTLGSLYVIEATASAGHSTDEVVAEVDRVLANLHQTGISDDEVAVAKVNWEAAFLQGLENISSKADLLGMYNTRAGDPGYISKDMARYLAVDTAGVKGALDTWLVPERVVLHVLPKEAP